jgi:hypothetical protein
MTGRGRVAPTGPGLRHGAFDPQETFDVPGCGHQICESKHSLRSPVNPAVNGPELYAYEPVVLLARTVGKVDGFRDCRNFGGNNPC